MNTLAERRPGDFRAALLAGWILLAAAGIGYARVKHVPLWIAVPVLLAFLIEFPFYLAAGFARARQWVETHLPRGRLVLVMAISGVLPYLIYAGGTGRLRAAALAQLAAYALALSAWFAVLPRGALTDAGFLALLGIGMFTRWFDSIYGTPLPGLKLEVLGRLMLFHLTFWALLVVRGLQNTGFGFVPSRREWWIGLKHFLLFVPVGLPLGLALGVVRYQPARLPLWLMLATFAAIFWVLALWEELVFRGFVQNELARRLASGNVALWLASAFFGLCHLPFRAFPNWRHALLAGVMGLFCGHAYREGGGIRAGMVMHALTVMATRLLFVWGRP